MSDPPDIAIVGMAGRFPGAPDLERFWRNLADGVEGITRFSDEELLRAGVPAEHIGDPAYVKAAPVLEEPGQFDASFFGYSPAEAAAMDPQHRLLLELAVEALENAGCDPGRYAGRIGVFAGTAFNTYYNSTGLDRRLAKEYIGTLIGADKDFLSTRISYKLNLTGPSITVQTACSTSMVALHLARQSLLSGEVDMALVGAVSVRVPHRAGYFCDGGGIVSADGHVRAFDASANGTVFGSGGGMLVLKRLADAADDRDTVHAIVKGSAVNNDGAGKAGYTAPGVDSQADAIVEALANAGVEADAVTYVEAHGSGTPLGDAVEMRALTKAFRSATQRSGFCALGSVKTNIGHLDAAAGIAGLLKTVLALKHRKLVPSLNFTAPNPQVDFAQTPFYVNTQLKDWIASGPRRAAVLSTGMGGTNAVAVLEEAPAPAEAAPVRMPQLLVLSAATESALDEAGARLREFLERADDVSIADAAYTLQAGRKALAHRRCLVSASREDAVAALGESPARRVSSGRVAPTRRPRVFLLPGIGDQYAGMGRGLYEGWGVFRDEVDRCAAILQPDLGRDLRAVLYPPETASVAAKGIDLARMLGRKPAGDGGSRPLDRTLFAQAAQFSVDYAASRLWQSLGVVPDAIVGHSMGEYVAACLAGVMSLEDALSLIALRAKLVEALPRGAMLAVMLSEAELRGMLPKALSISLINGPQLCVVSGAPAEVADFEAKLGQSSVVARRVANAHAFHSPMLAPIEEPFREQLRRIRLHAPTIPYVSNVTGKWIEPGEATSPDYWVAHALRTARFDDALRTMWTSYPDPVLVEAGPGRTLGVLAMQHPAREKGGEPLLAATIRPEYENLPDTEFLLEAVGRLWLNGAEIRWEAAPPAGRRKVPLPSYPFERQVHWLPTMRTPDATVAGSIARNADSADWLYVPSWKRLLPRSAAAKPRLSSWLVFADRGGFAALVAPKAAAAGQDVVIVQAGNRFRQEDARRFTLDPRNYEHYTQLLEALQAGGLVPGMIVHAWGLTDASGLELGFFSLAFLARALGAAQLRHEIELCVLSEGAQEVLGTEALAPEKAAALGACLVIRQEYPHIRVRSVDIDVAARGGDRESAADMVLGELLDPDASLMVAHRNGQRWVQIYERVAPGPRIAAPSFRKEGVYLITGGLGKVGAAISRYLARTYGARLALVGRRPSAPQGMVSEIERLGGQVLYLAADVADEDAMRRAVAETCRRFGALHGVIHGAGIVGRDGYRELKHSDPEGCEAHFRAKVAGLLALQRALGDLPLDFCLLMSSLTSILGGIGQAAYAASNLYMDAFARKHRRNPGTHWLSVNWDVWRLGGEGDAEAGESLKALGMSAEEGAATMEAALAIRDAPQLVVSTGDLAARIAQWVRMDNVPRRATIPSARSRACGRTRSASTRSVSMTASPSWAGIR
jgi:phthiocerol/phenolphthiocerol synthesis type-I polyketide synthase E